MSKIVQLLITQCTRSVFSRLENHEKNSFVPLVGFLPRASPDLGPFLALIAYERYYATTRVALASGLILNEIGAEADIACYNRFSAQDVMVSLLVLRFVAVFYIHWKTPKDDVQSSPLFSSYRTMLRRTNMIICYVDLLTYTVHPLPPCNLLRFG